MEIKTEFIFNPKIAVKSGKDGAELIYSDSGIRSGKERSAIISGLKKKAAGDSIKFKKRKISSAFMPSFEGFLFFAGDAPPGSGLLIKLGRALCGRIEKDFGVNAFNFSIIDAGKSAESSRYSNIFLNFEFFNYSFHDHKAVKSEFAKSGNARKISALAQELLKKTEKSRSRRKLKDLISKDDVSPEIPSGYSAPGIECENIPEEDSGSVADIGEQVRIISLNWSLLSPAENVPVLEKGEPEEILGASMVRIYFQKPNVRFISWRFRDFPRDSVSRRIMRIYRGKDMLWYESLDHAAGNKYIIFPEGIELSETWAEIGYIDERGGFRFTARTPEWPPSCLVKKLPELKGGRVRKIFKTDRALIGGTESIPGGRNLPVEITSSGAGLTDSGAGI